MPEEPTASPDTVLRPASAGELARLLREARGGPGLSPRGAGSQWARWGRLPAVGLDLRALPAEPRLSAANLTVTVPAWWRLHQLDALLAPHGLWYPVDAGDGGAATVGGHVAAATAGIRRTGLGPARDWVLGVLAVLPDGREVRPGGEMIKNVAGYNVHRVLVGSLGMLAVLVEVSLRIAPRPERHVTLRARFETPAAAWAALSPLRRQASTLVAAEWLRAGPGVEVLLAFEGPTRAVEHQSGAAAQELRRAAGLAPGTGDGVELAGGDGAAALWNARRERLFGPAVLRLRAGVRPSELPRLWSDAAEVLAGRAWDGIARGYGGVLEIVIPAGSEPPGGAGEPDAPAGLVPAVQELRRRAEALGGYLQVRGAPPGSLGDLPWTAPSPDGHLHRRLKAVFDPDGVLAGAAFLLPEPGGPAPAMAASETVHAKGGSAGGRV
ncbi:FAD-binding oxidoreductase [Caldinitratiruptor microaerophilus]|uniref:FAD-linked oxidase n=1 Tax=Caldinitratiruptor microaerophilus TaxID=671077 RepID=A0AA35CMX6_9FIRM|nr:FAD-binding oxidoreductase [Caldinitratiruptor microaerophilus]BDG62264.1 FAD-linked oxidase [Caldinitratiruptor microaerophilus]